MWNHFELIYPIEIHYIEKWFMQHISRFTLNKCLNCIQLVYVGM